MKNRFLGITLVFIIIASILTLNGAATNNTYEKRVLY